MIHDTGLQSLVDSHVSFPFVNLSIDQSDMMDPEITRSQLVRHWSVHRAATGGEEARGAGPWPRPGESGEYGERTERWQRGTSWCLGAERVLGLGLG